MALISLSFGDRELKLKESALNVANLSMVFRLESQGIFIHSQDGEISLPDDDGKFHIDALDAQKKYIVNGNPVAVIPSIPSLSQSPIAMPIPIPYQNERSRLNPPPGIKRPRFTTSSTSTAAKTFTWKKAFIVVDIDTKGAVTEKFQIHLVLQEETATVEKIQEQLKGQLGYEVNLLDSKHLPILSNDMTKGKFKS